MAVIVVMMMTVVIMRRVLANEAPRIAGAQSAQNLGGYRWQPDSIKWWQVQCNAAKYWISFFSLPSPASTQQAFIIRVPQKNRIELSPCQKRVPKKWHFGWPNENSETTFMSQTSPKNDVIDLVLSVYHFWMGFEPFFKYCNFLPFFHLHEPLHKNCSLHFGYGPITLN